MISSKIQQIENINNLSKTILASVAIFLAGYIQTSVLDNKIDNKVLAILIIAVTLLICVEVGSIVIEYFINNNSWIRKIILGEEFFEGLWIDVTEIKTYALIRIKYEKGFYLLQGESYNSDGELLGTWKSVNSWISNGKLECYYKGNYDDQVSDFDGRNEFSFMCSNGKIPCRFTGYYMDIVTEFRQYRIIGERIEKDIEIKLTNPSEIKNFIKKWGEENSGVLIDKSKKTIANNGNRCTTL
ncbi:hypothetical protein KORDIASMS9_02774 [Kordia sp. SMS9]|uniref:hypothetical protein n=1 Tax=Kordia sp. SMS9 TaxID=2282170 RepID=UPI000E0E0712|nr:hypothetical protein [Kordia sp. SMS9]AXG70534.1 hypothetical protein KORDIASMS9_02774 [Kordia sp. SMS9]